MRNQVTQRTRVQWNRIDWGRLRAAATALALACGAVAAPSAKAQVYQVLYAFSGGTDGAGPYSGLVQDAAGNLYGTTPLDGSYTYGVVFKLDPAGAESVLYAFTGAADGGVELGGLVRDAQGNLYGTTEGFGSAGGGTVFKLDPAGSETVLYNFNSVPGDGNTPRAGLVRDQAGNLYGTTFFGGSGNAGTVFKVNAAGAETILYSFTGGTDGGSPYSGLIRDAEGNLYGTTSSGGTLSACGFGCGVVFKVSPAGHQTVLHRFTGTDGAYPVAGLVRDAAGNLYGTTYEGGGNNLGTVFKLDTAGTLTSLHSFAGGADGANPNAGLTQSAAGGVYGTTALGGVNAACPSGCGTVFGVSATGKTLVLHRFKGGASGAYPEGGLLLAGGSLYGTTSAGGAYDAGVIFKLTP